MEGTRVANAWRTCKSAQVVALPFDLYTPHCFFSVGLPMISRQTIGLLSIARTVKLQAVVHLLSLKSMRIVCTSLVSSASSLGILESLSLLIVLHTNVDFQGGYDGKRVLSDFHKFRLKPIGVPPMALVNDFGRLVNQPDMSDVTFIIEGQKVHGHRAILAVRSEYFRALLFNGLMRESVTAGAAVNPIALSDVSYSVFLKVLEYLYTDSIKDVTLELGMHLLIASEQFMLDRLKALCEDLIRREISAHNAINILVVSHQHNAAGLKEIALEFILENLQQKAIQSGLSDLKSEPDLLVEIIQLSTKQTFAGPSEHPSAQIQQQQQQADMFMNGGPPFGGGDEWNAPR